MNGEGGSGQAEWEGGKRAKGGRGGKTKTRKEERRRRRSTVLQVELDCWPVRRFAHPYVEVFALSSFEEEDIVAIVEFGEFIELVELGLCIYLAFFPAVREEGVKIVEEMAMSVGDAAGAEDEDSLLDLGSCGCRCGCGCRFGSCFLRLPSSL